MTSARTEEEEKRSKDLRQNEKTWRSSKNGKLSQLEESAELHVAPARRLNAKKARHFEGPSWGSLHSEALAAVATAQQPRALSNRGAALTLAKQLSTSLMLPVGSG